MRIGIGYDIHQLMEGRKLILGGVEIPFEKGLLGHSDADVLLHAISDAILGAAALGDIGKHFPDTDPKYKGIDSRELLRNVIKLVRNNGYGVSNIDAIIIAENPKMMPHIEAMRRNIADDLGVSFNSVSVKATTNGGIGGSGRGEAIAAQTIVLLISKSESLNSKQISNPKSK